MKIIKQGYVPIQSVDGDINCWKCGAVLQASANDVRCDQAGNNYVECPCCKAFLNVSGSLAPPVNGQQSLLGRPDNLNPKPTK